jgi:carbonic anhydrase
VRESHCLRGSLWQAWGPVVIHRYVSPWRTPWTYEGAAQWAELDSLYAACNGSEQSRVDIKHAQAAKLPPLRFDYRPGTRKYVINNGHTIRVDYVPGNGNFLIVGSSAMN